MPRVRTSSRKSCGLSTEGGKLYHWGMSSHLTQVPRAKQQGRNAHARHCAQQRDTATGYHSPPDRTSLALHSVASNSDYLCLKKNAWLTCMLVGRTFKLWILRWIFQCEWGVIPRPGPLQDLTLGTHLWPQHPLATSSRLYRHILLPVLCNQRRDQVSVTDLPETCPLLPSVTTKPLLSTEVALGKIFSRIRISVW